MSDLPATEFTAPPSATKIPPVRGLFVSWAKLRRADTIAHHLGIPSYTVRYLYRGYRGTSAPLTVWKYNTHVPSSITTTLETSAPLVSRM